MKRCSRCGKQKPDQLFYALRTRPGLSIWCKPCYAEDYAANREKRRKANKRSRIRRMYGLDVEDYEALIAVGCSVCGRHERVSMDHDHARGTLRAPLCNSCNVAIAMAGDDPGRLEALAEYVRDKKNADADPIPPGDTRGDAQRRAWAEGRHRALRFNIDPTDLRSLYLTDGLRQAEIAELYGCSQNLIFYLMRKHGIEARPPRRGRSPTFVIDPADLRGRYLDDGMTRGELAALYGCSKGNIGRLLTKHRIRKSD